jgi:hypothetical protein
MSSGPRSEVRGQRERFGGAPFVFATGIYASGDWESAPWLPASVIDALARYTTLPLVPRGVNVRLDSEELFEHPFIFLTGHQPVFFSAAERRNLSRFVDRGGFVFVDDHNHDIDGEFHRTVVAELTGMFGALRDVPNDHPLYRAFFTFKDGPPATSHELNGWGDNLVHKNLQAVEQGDRISVLYSSKDYSSEWNYHPDSKRFSTVDNTRFGVNIIVYALTR